MLLPHLHWFHFTPQVRRALRTFTYFLGLFTLFRVAFYFAFAKQADVFSAADAFKAFAIGLRFDIRLAIILCLPLLIFPWSKKIGLYFYTFLQFWVLVFYIGDIGYYSYLGSRINARIFEFFKNMMISTQMVFETYNVPLWLFVLAAFLYFNFWFFKKYIFVDTSLVERPRKAKYFQRATLFVGVLFGLHNSLDQYPLRWSEAYFTQNMFISQLAMNPIHYVVDTSAIAKKDFDINLVRKYYDTTARYLGVISPDAEKLNFKRPIEFTPKFSTQPNIVYIVMESMVAYKTGAFGNPAGASPALDELANSGWLFRNFYVPTEGTARSMFCILTGVPDINAKSTSSRNPFIINQNTLMNSLKNYEKFYFIGGSASWGNIRGVYMNNVKNLQMYEGDRLGASSTDVWGLSDLDLFRQTAKILRERDQSKPFVALIQSASYHRPYTIPKDHGDFQLQNLTPDELTRYGFSSNEEYNSFRMADYSLGEFFKLAKDDPYFKNTIFIIHGDHGLPHHKAQHLTDGYKFFGLNRFHTPLVIYSPLIDEPKEWPQMITEPDVWPTVLGLMGQPGTNTALGRNVFAVKENEPRYAFSYVYYSDPLQIMLYDQEHIVIGTEHEIESMHEYNSESYKEDVKEKNLDKFNEMQDILKAIFESSKYILQHNPKIEH